MEQKLKKRIVLLTDCLADLAGGAEKQIFELAKGLSKDHFDIDVVTLDCWGKASESLLQGTGCRLHVFRVVRIYGLSGWAQGLRFYQFLRNNRVSVIMTYHFSSDLWGTFWGRLAGVKTIISNRRDTGFWRGRPHIWAYRLINRWVSRVVVVAESVRRMVVDEEKFDPSRVELIPNGVNIPVVQPHQKKDLGLAQEDVVLMHVANLKPVKGHRCLLKAVSRIAADCPRLKLVLIGKDEMNGQIQSLAVTLGIQDRCLFLGKRDDVPRLLALADVCLLTSLSEGMSNSILEYMAAGKPVIATHVGGNGELIQNGFNGLLVPKEDAASLAKAIKTLVQDAGQRVKMGENGLKLAQTDFSMAAMIDRYTRLIADHKILHLISSSGLFGAEQVILTLAGHGAGVSPIIGAIDNQHNSHLEILEEARRRGLTTRSFMSRGPLDFRTIFEVRKFISDHRVEIVHSHNYKSDLIAFLATRGKPVKWVATNHVWHGTDSKLRFYEKLDAVVLKFADRVIGVSEEIKQALEQRKVASTVISNGIDVARFAKTGSADAQRLALGIGPSDCVVAIVGRLAEEKRHDVFLEAGRIVCAQRNNVKLLIVGDGPLREGILNQILALGLRDKAIVAGIRKDMPIVYRMADILVSCSSIEGLPMTILEAMASSLPVIATPVGAVPEVIKHRQNGLLLPVGDPVALASGIMELIDDPDFYRQLSQQAYSDVRQNFSDAIMAERYKILYHTCLA